MVWEENKHPRDKSGQFTSKGNEGQGGSDKEKDARKELGKKLADAGYDINKLKSVDETLAEDEDFDNDFEEEFKEGKQKKKFEGTKDKKVSEKFGTSDKLGNALSNKLGTNVKRSKYDKNIYETEDGEEYLVLNEHDAYQRALDEVKSFLDDQGIEGFTEDFRDWAVTNAIDEDWMNEVIDEQIEYAQEEDPENVDYYENMRDNVDEFVAFMNDIGSMDELSKHLDTDYVAEEAVSWDGVAHFLATYDGDEIELDNGLFAYRVN